jgi:hypothetical protein
MKENNEKEAIIECVCRRYRVQMPGGMVTEVESTKPLTVQMNHELLEEDNEINSFFAHHKIMSIRHMVTSPTKQVQERKTTHGLVLGKDTFSPRQRLNHLLKMKGEFTRHDYQKYMLDTHRVKIATYMAYDDLRSAMRAKRLEKIEPKSGRLQKYKILDPVEIDENLYRSIIIKDHRVHMGIVQ